MTATIKFLETQGVPMSSRMSVKFYFSPKNKITLCFPIGGSLKASEDVRSKKEDAKFVRILFRETTLHR